MNLYAKAEQIYNDLNIKGAGLGSASIGIIMKSLESIHETETTSKDFANVMPVSDSTCDGCVNIQLTNCLQCTRNIKLEMKDRYANQK